MRLRAIGVTLGEEITFYGMPIVSMTKGSRIIIGDRVVLCSDSRFTDLGVNHAVILRTLRSGAEILIGNDVGMSGGTICAAIRVSIGGECLIGANVTIADTDFHACAPVGRRFNSDHTCIAVAAVVIGKNVFVGTQSVLLKGITIGDNSIVGANSLVSRNIATNVIAGGNPARIIRSFLPTPLDNVQTLPLNN